MTTDASIGVGTSAPDQPQPDVAPAAPLSGNLLRRQIIQYAPGVLLPAVVAMISAAVFTRVFSSDEYGRFSLAMSVASIAILLISQWLHQGVARFVPGAAPGEDLTRLKGAIGLASMLVLSVATILGMVAVAVAQAILPAPWPRDVLGATALVMSSVVFGPLGAVVQSEMRARRYSLYVVSASLMRLLLSLGLVFLVARDSSFLLVAQAGALALVLPFLWRDARLPALRAIIRRWRESWPIVRSIASYGFPVVGFVVAGTLLDLSDRWIIQYYRGAGEVGIYAANYSLVFGTIGLVALPMLLATHPFLMRAWESGDRPAAGRWLGIIVEWYIIAGALVVGTIGFFSHDIATLMLGAAFRPGYRIIPIVLAGMITWQLGMYSHKPLEFTERTGTMFALCVAVTAVNFLANLVVVPAFGYMGAAWTSLISYVLYTVVVTGIGRRILPWGLRWRRVGGSLAIVGGGLLSAWAVRVSTERAFGYLPALLTSAAIAAGMAIAVVVREVVPLLTAARANRAASS